MKDYELMISQFVDNELSTTEQQELFLFLSENKVGREMLFDFIEIKKESKSFYSELNVEMENKKVIAIDNKIERKQKRMFYFSAAAAILFGFLFLINQFKENPVATKYQNLQTEMIELQESYSDLLKKQTDLIRVNNQLYVETQKRKTSKIVKGNRDNNNSIKTKPSKGVKQLRNKSGNSISSSNKGRMLASLQNIQIIQITKNDFLGEQIIGN
jgi:hypothetical protein